MCRGLKFIEKIFKSTTHWTQVVKMVVKSLNF